MYQGDQVLSSMVQRVSRAHRVLQTLLITRLQVLLDHRSYFFQMVNWSKLPHLRLAGNSLLMPVLAHLHLVFLMRRVILQHLEIVYYQTTGPCLLWVVRSQARKNLSRSIPKSKLLSALLVFMQARKVKIDMFHYRVHNRYFLLHSSSC